MVVNMETIKLSGAKLTNEEREVYVYYDPIERVWMLDAFVPKFFRRALKKGWTPIREYVYDDGTVCGMSFIAPERALTFRNVEKKKLSEGQLKNLNTDND